MKVVVVDLAALAKQSLPAMKRRDSLFDHDPAKRQRDLSNWNKLAESAEVQMSFSKNAVSVVVTQTAVCRSSRFNGILDSTTIPPNVSGICRIGIKSGPLGCREQ
ncbi:MAG: hypothetical protein WBW16_15585 [Bacteroidota bacterium]